MPRTLTAATAALLAITTVTSVFAVRMTWVTTEKDKDLLTGEPYVYVRIASGALGKNRRFVDILKKGDNYTMRFVVPEPTNTQTTIWAPGVATSRNARELGDTLSWMVEGKSKHDEAPTLSKRPRHMGVTDYEASWPVGCQGLRELVTGKTLRVVMPEFNGEFDLAELPKELEKTFGLTNSALIKGTAPICVSASASPAPDPSVTPSSSPPPPRSFDER
jgi:hypothetical protein